MEFCQEWLIQLEHYFTASEFIEWNLADKGYVQKQIVMSVRLRHDSGQARA